nr:diguanylate cyclase [Virgisporangium ochraceum]
MISGLTLGLACLHPSMLDLETPSAVVNPDLGPVRLTALAFATLLAPAALLIQCLRGAPLFVPLICASCSVLFLPAIFRLAGVLAVQRRMAVTDMLTGLHSRRYFEDASSAQARRRNHTAVLLLDIDHFKRVNDTYGHDGGDLVLREVGQRLPEPYAGGRAGSIRGRGVRRPPAEHHVRRGAGDRRADPCGDRRTPGRGRRRRHHHDHGVDRRGLPAG